MFLMLFVPASSNAIGNPCIPLEEIVFSKAFSVELHDFTREPFPLDTVHLPQGDMASIKALDFPVLELPLRLMNRFSASMLSAKIPSTGAVRPKVNANCR